MLSTHLRLKALVAWGVALTAAQFSHGALLGVNPDFPVLSFDSQGVTAYDATTGVLTIDALPIAVRFAPGAAPIFVNPTGDPAVESFRVQIMVDPTGAFADGADGDDFVVVGEIDDGAGTVYSGTLLSGEVVAFGFLDTGTVTDQFDFRCAITGGALAPLFGARDIGIVVTSEQSTFTGDFAVNFTGGAKGNVGPVDAVCNVNVMVEGCILGPTMDQYVCDKPIDAISMIWNGTQVIRVKAWKGRVGSTLLADIDNIHPGDRVTVAGYTGSPYDVRWEIFLAGTNCKLGESEFHLSCSDRNMNGPEDCGKPQGNGKCGRRHLINDWLLDGIVDEGGVLECSPGGGPNNCLTEIPAPSGNACRGRVSKMTLRYTGESCEATHHSQNNASCSGDPRLEPVVKIKATNRSNPSDYWAKVWFSGNVALDGTFTVDSRNGHESVLYSETWIHIFDLNHHWLQSVKINTSCCEPLKPGDQFGGVVITEMRTTQGGTATLGSEVEYTYTVANDGTVPLTNVVVIDDIFGPVPGSPIPSIAAGESVVLTLTVRLSEETTNTVSVSGNLGPNIVCQASASTTITAADIPADCCAHGKPRVLTFEYTGKDCSATSHSQEYGRVTCNGDPMFEPAVRIRGSDKWNPNDATAKVWFDGMVALGEPFDLDANVAGESRLRSDTYIHIFDTSNHLLQTVKFATSCYQPLFTGNQFGGVKLVGCVGENDPVPGQFCRGHVKPKALTMRYNGGNCAASNHSQAPSKVLCSGDPANAPSVRIRASNKSNPSDHRAKVWFDGPVSLNDAFTIDARNAHASKLSSNTWIHVFDTSNHLLQVVKFHTSCSQPLNQGDQFGGVVLEGFTPSDSHH